MSSIHPEDDDVFKIPFPPEIVKRLEAIGFQRETDDTYNYEVLINAWEDSETGLNIQATMWNGNQILAVGEDDDRNELFTLQGPPDYVLEKLEPILPRLTQKQELQHKKNQEKWKSEEDDEPSDNPRFRMTELVKSILQEGLKDEFALIDGTKEGVEYFVKKMHYLGKFPTGIQKIFLVVQNKPEGQEPVGMVIYGRPFFTAPKFLEPAVSPSDVTELKRHWTSDDIKHRNIESYIVAQANKRMKQENPNLKVILTFADEKAGHVGTIYQATNAIYLGPTPDGKHKYMYIVGGNEKAIKALLPTEKIPYPKKGVKHPLPKGSGLVRP